MYWCPVPATAHGVFDDLAAALRPRGHRVLAVTLTGIAERAHLLHAGVNLETHIADVLSNWLCTTSMTRYWSDTATAAWSSPPSRIVFPKGSTHWCISMRLCRRTVNH